jgi:hypothetical protein
MGEPFFFVSGRPFGWIGVICGAFSSVWNVAEAPVAILA